MVVCAPQLLRHIEINLVNKIVKNNNPSFVPMRIEKMNNFIDMQYMPKSDILVVMSKSNSLFIFKELELVYQITDFNLQKGLTAQRVVIYDKVDQGLGIENEETGKHQQAMDEFKFGMDSLVPDEVKGCSFQCSVMDAPLLDQLKSQRRFKKLAVGQKHVFVASKGGYVTIFLIDSTLKNPPAHLKTAKMPEHIVSFKQLLLNSAETFIVCVGKYPFQIKEKLLESGRASPNRQKRRKQPLSPKAGGLGSGTSSPRNNEDVGFDKKLYDYNLKYDVIWVSLSGLMDGNVMVLNRIYPQGVHDGAILQMASCRSRSEFVSIADGKNVRLWSHTNDWSGEENFYLDEQPMAVDWHPMGAQLALGFATGLRLYIIREGKLLLAYHRGTKNTTVVKYTPSGSLLAAADSFYILLVDTLKYEVVKELAGHSAVIQSLSWGPKEDYLFTMCKGNTLLVWDIADMRKTDKEELIPICRYHYKQGNIVGVEYDPSLEVLAMLTDAHLLVQSVKDTKVVCDFRLSSDDSVIPTLFLLSKKLNAIIVAFKGGFLRVYYWPLNPNREEYYEIYIDSESSVTGLLFTPSSKYLLVGLENGGIFCLETTKILEGMPQAWGKLNPEWDKANKLRNYYGLAGFSAMDATMLTSVQRIATLDRNIEDLNRSIYNEKNRYLWILQRKWEENKEETDRLVEKCKKEYEDYKENAENEQKERMDRLAKLKQELAQVEEMAREEQGKVRAHHVSLIKATEECDQEYETELKKQKMEMKLELDTLLKEHKKAISEVKGTQEEFIQKAKKDIEKLVKEFEELCVQREEVLKRQEEDHENEFWRAHANSCKHYNNLLKIKEESMKCAQQCVNLQKEKEDVDKKLKKKRDKLDKLTKELERTETGYEMAQKRILAMNQQLLHSKLFEKEKKKEVQANTLFRNTLESGTLLLQSKVEELNSKKVPMVEKLHTYEEYTTRAYNEIILLLQMRGATERSIEENKRKLTMIEGDYQKMCKLYKILCTMFGLYEKGIEKLLEEKREAGIGIKGIRTEFAKKVVEFIGELDKELPLDQLEKLRDFAATQKSLERNSQLMKRAKMVIEKEKINNRIEQNLYKLSATQRLETEAVNTLTRENIKLLSERNLLKQKCGELTGEAAALENSINEMLAFVKDKTIDMGDQLEQNVKSDILEKIEERHKMLMRKQGKRTNLADVLGKNYEHSLGLGGRRGKSASLVHRGEYDKLIQTARVQKVEMQSQRHVLSSLKQKTSELTRALSPVNSKIMKERRERAFSRRDDRRMPSSQGPASFKRAEF